MAAFWVFFLLLICIFWFFYKDCYYLDIIILKLGKAPGMSGECIVAATHSCSLSWDRGPDDPGRTDVPEVSLQPLGGNVIMRRLPPFFFHILARNWHLICNWNHRIKTYLWSQKDYTIIFFRNGCLCNRASEELSVWDIVLSLWFPVESYLWLLLFSYQLSTSNIV